MRYFRISMTVSQPLMETIFELLKNEDAKEFRMAEVIDGQTPAVPSPAKPTTKPHRIKHQINWALGFWPMMQPIFQAGGTLDFNDKRLLYVMEQTGKSPTSISSVFSALVRAGKLVRVGRGKYKLP